MAVIVETTVIVLLALSTIVDVNVTCTAALLVEVTTSPMVE